MAETARSSVDPYGFEYSDAFEFETYDEFMTNYLRVLARRAKKWDTMLGPSKTVGRGSKVKRYIRKGIPREHRGMLWMAVSRAQDMKDENPNLYKTLLDGPWNTEVVETIKIDIPRTFPDNIYFKYASDGKRKPLFNVLVAFAHQNLQVGYCQGLNFIAGILLLITDNEDVTFWLLRIMVEEILPDYYTKDMLGLLTDMEVLGELVRVKVPQVYQHLEKHGVAWPLVASKWFICLFAEVLPIETVLRIWDCLFYEGSKILFRVAVTLVMKNQQKLLAANSFPEILDIFKDVTHNEAVTDCHCFMQTIFKEPGSFPMSLVSKLRSQCRARVKQQQDKQQQQIKEQQKLMQEKLLKNKREQEEREKMQNGMAENPQEPAEEFAQNHQQDIHNSPSKDIAETAKKSPTKQVAIVEDAKNQLPKESDFGDDAKHKAEDPAPEENRQISPTANIDMSKINVGSPTANIEVSRNKLESPTRIIPSAGDTKSGQQSSYALNTDQKIVKSPTSEISTVGDA